MLNKCAFLPLILITRNNFNLYHILHSWPCIPGTRLAARAPRVWMRPIIRYLVPSYKPIPLQPTYGARVGPWYTTQLGTGAGPGTGPWAGNGVGAGNKNCIPWIAERKAPWYNSQYHTNPVSTGTAPDYWYQNDGGNPSRFGTRYNPRYYDPETDPSGARDSSLSRQDSRNRMYSAFYSANAYNPYQLPG